MINLGCASHNFRGLSLEDCVSFTSTMGFKFVDIGAFSEDFPVSPAAILKEPKKTGSLIKEVCARYNVTPIEFFICSVVIGDGTRVQPNDPDAERRKSMLEAFRKVCECAVEAGLSHIMGVPGEIASNDSPDHGLSISLDTLPRMMEIARDTGIGFTIEPHTRSILTTPEEVLNMLEKIPGLKLSLDYTHFIGPGFSAEEISCLNAHALHIHAKPARKDVPKCPFYEGEDYYKAMLQSLMDIKWQGIISMECMYPVNAPGLLEHPAFQTILLAGHVEKTLRELAVP